MLALGSHANVRLLVAVSQSRSDRPDRRQDSKEWETRDWEGENVGTGFPADRMYVLHDSTIPVDRMHASEMAGRNFALKIPLG